ncbi:MAG TPA: hypothetical protein VFW50_08070 [Streptosporangiaceae bacterium]|nr:hypothetical protein [Streptosporangiaceae bacterium]
MSIKSKVLAAAAVLTLTGGLSVAGTVAAGAATPQCGGPCLEVFSAKFATPPNLGFVETVFLGIPVRGVPTIVRPASSSNPAEDLIVPLGGPVPVSQFYADGMVSAAVNKHFGNDLAVQLEYAPYGHPTGLCTAVAVTAFQDEGLSLQPCSAPGTTVWILDFADSQLAAQGYFSIINGSDTDFAHPFAMTILGNPADQLFTPIILQHLIGNPGSVPANQLWGAAHGPVTP